jgi:hypothetical protein
METVHRMPECGPERLLGKAFRAQRTCIRRINSHTAVEVYLRGTAVCCEVHPTLGTEPQNILADGMYLVMLPVGAVRPNTWKRQFSTSAT